MNRLEWFTLGSLLAAIAGGSAYLGGVEVRLDYLESRHAGGRIGGSYEWELGNGEPRQMIRADSGFCFLTRVSGQFDGDREQVRVYVDGDFWFLHGQSAQNKHVEAEAHCWIFRTEPGEQ